MAKEALQGCGLQREVGKRKGDLWKNIISYPGASLLFVSSRENLNLIAREKKSGRRGKKQFRGERD